MYSTAYFMILPQHKKREGEFEVRERAQITVHFAFRDSNTQTPFTR